MENEGLRAALEGKDLENIKKQAPSIQRVQVASERLLFVGF